VDVDELWETALDPAKRMLVRVQLEDVVKADETFRTLMGGKVEPRREFIQHHTLEVKDIDYRSAWLVGDTNPAIPDTNLAIRDTNFATAAA
jgi:hypothetical protein